jgi:hypothetical protein
MVQPGTPIVTLGDLSRPWVNVYVGERDLGKVRLGMTAQVTVDSFPDHPFPGKVTFIAERAEFTPKNIQTPDERVKLVYRVRSSRDPTSRSSPACRRHDVANSTSQWRRHMPNGEQARRQPSAPSTSSNATGPSAPAADFAVGRAAIRAVGPTAPADDVSPPARLPPPTRRRHRRGRRRRHHHGPAE